MPRSKDSTDLQSIIEATKESILAKSISNKSTNSIKPKIIDKREITDKSLINNIDDYDKNEWVNLRTSYANKLFWLLACEIVGLFILIILIGLQYLTIADSTLNVTIITIMVQTFLLVREIVTNLFKKNGDT
jgi:hypothetical protein